jgi:hypothetical protein
MNDRAAAGPHLKLLAWGALIGLLYGLSIRFGAQFFPNSSVFRVMTVGFVFLMPLAMGFASVFVVERRSKQRLWIWFLLPWVPVLACEVAVLLLNLEGLICVAMFTPIALATASLGGVAAGVIVRYVPGKSKGTSLVCILFLPLVVAPLEQRFPSHREVRTVETVTDIRATPEIVWRNIERVPRIEPTELQPSWSRRIGFPAPVEATLSREGVGGVRHATFQGGVLFVETIDAWEPEKRLAFSIRAQGAEIPPTTLDEHVKVGGAFFDVLHGEYRLEPLPNGKTRLHLSSHHQVSTDFNWYAHLWTDAVMADLQKTILRVVKNRCETAVGRGSSPG